MRIHKLHPTLLPAEVCLFLDVDGTLIEFGPTPDAVVVDAALLKLLQDAHDACNGAVALISGRSLAQLDALFAPRAWTAAGLHGVERRDAAGHLHVHARNQALPQPILAALNALVQRHPGLLVEEKGPAAAVHYRLAGDLEHLLREELHQLIEQHGDDALHVQPGAFVLEVKPAGITKAHAIEAFLTEPPFAGRTPVFAGDDLTDVYGFEAVARHDGLAIAVGPRVTAMLNLESPAELHDTLREFIRRAAAA